MRRLKKCASVTGTVAVTAEIKSRMVTIIQNTADVDNPCSKTTHMQHQCARALKQDERYKINKECHRSITRVFEECDKSVTKVLQDDATIIIFKCRTSAKGYT
jgi:hypothetical protein